MPPSTKSRAAERHAARPATEKPRASVIGIAIAAWLVPGAAHFLLGQTRKAIIFFVALMAMFGFGIGFGGRLFPFVVSDPIVFLEALAEWLVGVPRGLVGLAGLGDGAVTEPAYEYGNAFLIVAGLLNALVILDAVDVASGRKRP